MCVDRQQIEEAEADSEYSYIDIKPCNSFLRKLIYELLQHR